MFDFHTYVPIKRYYPLMWHGKFYYSESYIKCETDAESIYTLCKTDKNGKAMCIVAYFSDNVDMEDKDIKIDFGKKE